MNTTHLEIFIAKDKADADTFWRLFNSYINELSLHVSIGDDFDLEYFYSDEYREAIEILRTRHMNPLTIFLIHNEGTVLGFLMYVIYLDEGGKCFLMEYYLEPAYRGSGYGKAVYSMAEEQAYADGAKYMELTPTNETNESFWKSVGFMKSADVDEDNKYFYRKTLSI
ncbi:Acetyltransferase (GNAT) family protein [compost metagenome]